MLQLKLSQFFKLSELFQLLRQLKICSLDDYQRPVQATACLETPWFFQFTIFNYLYFITLSPTLQQLSCIIITKITQEYLCILYSHFIARSMFLQMKFCTTDYIHIITDYVYLVNNFILIIFNQFKANLSHYFHIPLQVYL